MRRISYRPYAHSSMRSRSALHAPFGWTLLFGLFFIASATLVPKEIIVTSDPSFKEIAQILIAKTGLPWRWRPPSGGTAGSCRIAIRQNTGKKPPGLVLGRVPLLPVVHRWNPVATVTYAELVRIKNGDIKRWDQLGGDAHPITTVSGSAAARSLQRDPWSFGWLYWPQLNFHMKLLKTQGSRFPWEGAPDAQTDYGWAVLELPHPQGEWLHLSRRMREGFLKRTVRKHFDGWDWLYGQRRAVVTVVGDMLFDRGITETAWDKYGDYTYVFGLTAHTLRSSDLVIGNLECPFNLKGWPINMFTGDPRAVPALRYGGLDIVSLANNHTLDCGTRGLLDTIGLLRQNGIEVVGAGVNREEARCPRIFRIRGIRIAVLAYTEVRKGFTYTRTALDWRAGTDRPGVNAFDLQGLREDLTRARRMADHVVVLCHWGDEYRYRPNDFQLRMAKAMLEHGADLVIGHHPHVVQGVAFGRRGLIAYSLGNFVFDQYPRSCREGLICRALVDRDRVIQVEFIPVLIEEERPHLLQGEAARKIIRQMGILSKGLDRELERGE